MTEFKIKKQYPIREVIDTLENSESNCKSALKMPLWKIYVWQVCLTQSSWRMDQLIKAVILQVVATSSSCGIQREMKTQDLLGKNIIFFLKLSCAAKQEKILTSA